MTEQREPPRQDTCELCSNLVDNQYCLYWRDIIPPDVTINQCEGWVDNGTVPF